MSESSSAAGFELETEKVLEQSQVTDESLDFMQKLIRQHLGAVMESVSSRFSKYPPRGDVTPEIRSLMLTMISSSLEQDHDIVLSVLLNAAIKVKDDLSGEESGVVNEFLRRCLDLIMGAGAETGQEFLQLTLEGLLQSDSTGEGTGSASSSNDTRQNPSYSGIAITIGNSTIDIALEDILKCFWTDWLDTECHWCHQAFVDKRPIRTICATEAPTSSTGDIHVRIFNRHFSCLKPSGALVVPISHVWDFSIREAHMSKQCTAEATYTMVRSIKTLIESSEEVYSPLVEFWHDYYSVPQWNKQVQESLLLQLPLIYHSADEILVQLSDIAQHHVQQLHEASLLSTFSLHQCLELITPLRALCASEWMQRMWVTLEYSLCKSACVMDQSNRIWRTIEQENIFSRDTFSRLVDGGQKVLLGMFKYAARFSRELSKPGEFLGGLANERGHFRQMCLGEAVELIARTQCQYFRDRFPAISFILQRNSVSDNPVDFPTRDTDACAMVWKGAMQRGDFSPLLLHPCEGRRGAIPGCSTPSWLVGCRSLDDVDWDLGDEKQSPGLQIIINNHSVETKLDFVGTIEEVQRLDVEESGELVGVDWTIRYLANISRSEGINLSAKRLVEGLNRVFPFDFTHEKAANVLNGMVFSFQELQERDEGFGASIDEQLAEYFGALEGEDGRSQREAAVKEIAQILELEKSIMQFASPVTRLTKSRHIARRRRDRGAVNGEPICKVKCPGCSAWSLLRLDLRPAATLGAKIYRIPGLTYSNSVQDGAGVVLQNGRIVGRMLYGAPSCGCRQLEAVQIE